MRILFCLLLFNGGVSAQSLFFNADSAFVSTVDLPVKQPFDTARAYQRINARYVYIISDKDLSDHFGYNVAAKFHEFNFTDFHILGTLECLQCLTVCHHDNGYRNCHRNACMKEWVWAKRENKKAFTTIPSFTIPWHERKDLRLYYDTIIKVADTSKWYTTGHGDCFAHFEYAVMADKYYPALILKEWNYWGGCRAGGGKQATIVFKEPAAVSYKIKRTILMKKWRN